MTRKQIFSQIKVHFFFRGLTNHYTIRTASSHFKLRNKKLWNNCTQLSLFLFLFWPTLHPLCHLALTWTHLYIRVTVASWSKWLLPSPVYSREWNKGQDKMCDTRNFFSQLHFAFLALVTEWGPHECASHNDSFSLSFYFFRHIFLCAVHQSFKDIRQFVLAPLCHTFCSFPLLLLSEQPPLITHPQV